MTTVPMPDGRVLDIRVGGADAGPVVVFHHGTPGSCIPRRGLLDAAAQRGLRVVTYSRAGYGDSARNAGRAVADIAADVAAILDHLGVEKCATAGWSGGGPHALATGALLPERVTGVLSIAGVAPYDAEGLDFLAGMGEDNHIEFNAALEGEQALRAVLEPMRPGLISADPEAIITELSTLLPQVDRAVLTGDVGADTAAGFAEALKVGIDGWVDDDFAFTRDWGFALDAISVPTFVWQGSEDLMVPFAHGQWLASHVPGATAHLLPGEGHLSVSIGAAGEMLDELATTLR